MLWGASQLCNNTFCGALAPSAPHEQGGQDAYPTKKSISAKVGCTHCYAANCVCSVHFFMIADVNKYSLSVISKVEQHSLVIFHTKTPQILELA